MLKNTSKTVLTERVGLKTQRSTNYRWDRAALGTCFGLILLGLIVLVGWYAHVPAVIRVFHGLIPMQYSTALCFLALGAAGVGLLTGRRLLLLGGGASLRSWVRR